MNGLDPARELKRLMPTVPLIMYSAFGDAFAEQQARLIGISELVSKSKPAAVLVSKLEVCCIALVRDFSPIRKIQTVPLPGCDH